jgi:hypothetical protein
MRDLAARPRAAAVSVRGGGRLRLLRRVHPRDGVLPTLRFDHWAVVSPEAGRAPVERLAAI